MASEFQQMAADYFRLGTLEQGVKVALQSLEARFVKGTRCHLCCARPTAFALVRDQRRMHLVGCPIDELQRAVAGARGADDYMAGVFGSHGTAPAAASDSAAGVVVGGSGGRS